MANAVNVFSGNETSAYPDTTTGSAEPDPELYLGSAEAPSLASPQEGCASFPEESAEAEAAPEAEAEAEHCLNSDFGYPTCFQDQTSMSFDGGTRCHYRASNSV